MTKQKGSDIMKTITGVFIGLMMCGVAWGETCVKTTFNVTYSCNGGTVAGTLPADATVQYGASFSPAAISTSMCTPPSGYIYAGQAVIVDGAEVAHYTSTSAKSFTYYYTTDIEIGPHWAPVAKPETLASHLYHGGRTYTYTNAASGTWTVEFYYGAVSGVSKCSTIKPENTAYGYYTGLLASDQDALEAASAGGQYCYCKMTEPYIAASPWVFYNVYGSASYCVSACANYCGSYVAYGTDTGRRFRASVFAAAGD